MFRIQCHTAHPYDILLYFFFVAGQERSLRIFIVELKRRDFRFLDRLEDKKEKKIVDILGFNNPI